MQRRQFAYECIEFRSSSCTTLERWFSVKQYTRA